MRVILIVNLLAFISVSLSNTVTQTDWSGGGGVTGPVTEWSNSYDIATQINDAGNSLCLEPTLFPWPLQHVVASNYDGAYSVFAADIDGDGDTDILTTAYMANEVTWWENSDAIGTIWIEHIVEDEFDGAYWIHGEDIDGDGDTDILAAAKEASAITWWENSDTAPGVFYAEHQVDTFFSGATCVYAADLDGDGDADIIGAADYADDITWWENLDGTGTSWTEHTVDNEFNGAQSVYATDIDGDGDIDILGAAYHSGHITFWENTLNTGATWVEHVVDDDFNGAFSVFAADVDGDDDTDILGASESRDEISWWENLDGVGLTWAKNSIDEDFDAARSVYAADLDKDGDIDVLGAAVFADEFSWWENTSGTGTIWLKHILNEQLNAPRSVFAADVDGDGDTDVLGAIPGEGFILWWDVMGFSTGTLESSILEAETVGTWEQFVSNEQEPTGTSVGFQFRSSDDCTNMGAWSDTVFTATTDLSSILADFTDFVQYRVILQTTDPAVTPVLDDVTISYSIDVSIGDTNLEEATSWGLSPASNPSFGSFAVHISLPQSAMVNLLLYDVTGRLNAQHSQVLPGGEHSVSFSNLHEGVYFCAMRAGDFTATERIIVLK